MKSVSDERFEELCGLAATFLSMAAPGMFTVLPDGGRVDLNLIWTDIVGALHELRDRRHASKIKGNPFHPKGEWR